MTEPPIGMIFFLARGEQLTWSQRREAFHRVASSPIHPFTLKYSKVIVTGQYFFALYQTMGYLLIFYYTYIKDEFLYRTKDEFLQGCVSLPNKGGTCREWV